MSCASQPLTLSQAQLGDLYMDQAIYHSGTDKIYGCRGQWLFKFNATTAALEGSLRIQSDGGGFSSISSVGTNLYIGTTFATDDSLNLSQLLNRDIYIVDTGTFTVTGRFHFDTKLTYNFGGAPTSQYYCDGWFHLVTDGTKLFGSGNDGDIWTVDPTNLPGYVRRSYGVAVDISMDTFNNVIWIANPSQPKMSCWDIPGFNSCNNAGPSSGAVTGVCYYPPLNKVYFVRGTFELLMVDASTAMPGFNNFAYTVFNTGRINAIPYKVKSVSGLPGNPYNNKVLIPAFADDTVLIWDPSTDNVANMVVKTGFTSPFDIVNAPTASFALQTGTVGLKAI